MRLAMRELEETSGLRIYSRRGLYEGFVRGGLKPRPFLVDTQGYTCYTQQRECEMTRVQVLLEKKEVVALRREATESGKSTSQLVREAIDNTYTSRFEEGEIEQIAADAKRGIGTRKFKDAASFLKHLWSL